MIASSAVGSSASAAPLLTPAWLHHLGLETLDPEEEQLLLDRLAEELELRVGYELAERLDDNQLDEFARLLDGGADEPAGAWLEAVCPDYRGVVRRHVSGLEDALRTHRDELLACALHGTEVVGS